MLCVHLTSRYRTGSPVAAGRGENAWTVAPSPRPSTRATVTETVWTLRLPQLRFGRGAIAELPHQLREIGVPESTRGVLITDETVAQFGHADRIRDVLEDAQFDVDLDE